MKHVLFIHGAGQGAYEEDGLLVASLQNALGFAYEVHYPKMVNEESPEYADWKTQIASELAALDDEVILVGHSVGGSVLLKYLSEEQVEKPIAGLFLLAAPYWGADEFWSWDEVRLPRDAADKLAYIPGIFLYHSRDDEIVPFVHLALYAARLPQATIREVDGRGHQLGNDLADVAGDIMRMETYDDDLSRFEAAGAAPLPVTKDQGTIEHDGARIWYASYGSGPPVILLHGGLGHSGNWGYQMPALVRNGYRAILIDSRGHGRSTRDARPFTYELMAADVLAVMNTLHIERAGLVGWSDGACIALILAAQAPARVAGVFFFACNMDPSGTKEITEFTPILRRCINRHTQDYKQLSATPDQFDALSDAVGLMQKTQPNYSVNDLARMSVPVVIVQSEYDEFIKREHAEYLARSIPNAEFIHLPGVSHFAPLQRPEQFNKAIVAFLGKVLP